MQVSPSAVVHTPQQQPQAPAQTPLAEETQVGHESAGSTVAGFGGMGEGGNPLSGKFPPTSLHGGWIQTKLEIGAVDDPLEHEADAVADKVIKQISQPNDTPTSQVPVKGRVGQITAPVLAQTKCDECAKLEEQEPEDQESRPEHLQRFSAGDGQGEGDDDGQTPRTQIQRKCAACEAEEEHTRVQTKRKQGFGPQIPMIQTQLSASKGGGNSLPAAHRKPLETAFGADLSQVRIHTDAQAVAMSQSLNAHAFTHGRDIYFNEGRYQLASPEGKRLIAHELAHTLQQGAVTSGNIAMSAADPETIQRSCENLREEFPDTAHLSEPDRRLLDRRIRQCATEGLQRFRLEIATYPDSPEQHPDRTRGERYRRLLNRVILAQSQVDRQPNAAARLALADYFDAIEGAMRTNKVFAYSTSGSEEVVANNIGVIEAKLDPRATFDETIIARLDRQTRMFINNPELLYLSDFIAALYHRLDVRPLVVTASDHMPSNPDLDLMRRPNRSAFPARVTGPQTMVMNGTGAYTMSIDYTQAGPTLLDQVAAAIHRVGYTWEFYDITQLTQDRMQQRAQMLREAVDSGEEIPAITTGDLAVLRAMRQAPTDQATVGGMAAAGRRWERLGADQMQQLEDNWQDFTDPTSGSDGSFIGDLTTSLIGEFNLATTTVGAGFAVLSELLSSFSDLFGGVDYEREIPFPNREGWFMVRCIATPEQHGPDDNPVIYASSVDNIVVRVQNIRTLTTQNRLDLDQNLLARRSELEANLLVVTNPADLDRLRVELAAVNTEIGGTAITILQSRIAQLTALQQRTPPGTERTRLDERIRELQRALATGQAREAEFRRGTIVRPRAVFVSEEAGQSYPLLLQLGLISEWRGTYHYRLSDLSRPSGITADGYGASAAEAADRAILQFSREAPYGKGLLNITLPSGEGLVLPRTEFECRTRGGALALQRLEEVATVLTILGLLAVPGAGEVALVIGAAMAANRIYQRVQNHTFEWDTDSYTDVLTLLGAAATGVSAIGRMRVVRTSQMFAVVREDADIQRLIAGMNRTASRLELLEDFINWGGYMYGNMVTLREMADISAREMAGDISHADARRQRADMLLSALRDGAFQFAGFDAGESARRAHDSFAPLPLGDPGGTTGSHPGRDPSTVDPASRIPGESTPPRLPEVGVADHPGASRDRGAGDGTPHNPGDATVPPPRLRLPQAEVDAHMATLRARLPDMPAGLADLLAYDHSLLQRAAADPSVITTDNMRAWNDISMMSPMHPDTYAMLLDNPGLRAALLQNPAARAALKHCASPCFPANASADDIVALQALLAERAAANLPTDLRALNDFLYANRALSDLGDVVSSLRRDFEGTMSRVGTTDFVMPPGWAEGSITRPLNLRYILDKFVAQGLPHGLANAILANMHGLQGGDLAIAMYQLNRIMADRGREADHLYIDRILYALSDPASFGYARTLLGRAVQQPARMQNLLGRLSLGELQTLHPGTFDLTNPDAITNLETIVQNADVQTGQQVIDMINQAGYPGTTGVVTADLPRLLEILQRNQTGRRLTIAEVTAQITRANQARDAVAAGNYTIPLDASQVRRGSDMLGNLQNYLHNILVTGDFAQQLVIQLGTSALGHQLAAGTTDFTQFAAATDSLRQQVDDFVRVQLADRFPTPLTDAQRTTLVNRAFGTTRGNLFEVVAEHALRQAYPPPARVIGEYGLQVDGGETRPDNTVIVNQGGVLTVIFLEYKTGNSRERTAQSALRTLITGGGDPMPLLARSSPQARALHQMIEAAQASGQTVQFQHRLIEENP